MFQIIVLLVLYCIQGSVWGWAVNKIVENKGYHENWFWWGFFFGLLALVVALTKPDVPYSERESGSYFGEGGSIVSRNYAYGALGEREAGNASGGWKCTRCGKINASYVGTCGCGCDRSGNMPAKSAEQTQQANEDAQAQKRFCSSCGKQIEADSKVCRYCGAKTGVE